MIRIGLIFYDHDTKPIKKKKAKINSKSVISGIVEVPLVATLGHLHASCVTIVNDIAYNILFPPPP